MKYFQTGTLRFTLTAIMAVLINGTSSPAKVFLAKPGTNTLMMVRDVVRAWRSSGHPDEPAVIQLARGNYRITEPLHLNRQDGNTTWEARDPDQTLVSGGQPIGPFTADAAGIWHAHTALSFEQLYVNDRRSTRAEAPEEDFFHILEVPLQRATLVGLDLRVGDVGASRKRLSNFIGAGTGYFRAGNHGHSFFRFLG